MKDLKYIWLALILFPLVGMVSSCTEDETEEGEFDNWKQKNETFFNQVVSNSNYKKILTYTKDTTNPSITDADYIYVDVLEEGSGTQTALFTDSIFYTYRGRLIPSKTYEKGYVFEESFLGNFDWSKSAMRKACASWNPVVTATGTIYTLWTEGFCTALQHMKKGDHWMVYIPYQLAYGESGSSSIPAYSMVVFELAVADVWHPGESRPDFK